MHVLPRVRELHERFMDSLVVVGVHSGKFVTERKTDRIAMACERLGVTHPVVNDRQYRTWRDYAVSAWPTIALIDPEGYVVGVQPGEFDVEAIAEAIEGVIAEASARGTLVREQPDVPAREGFAAGAAAARSAARPGLSFPVRAVVVGDTLWVSDLGHGRVLECAWDGAAAAATVREEHTGFAEPRGIAGGAGAVYVADRAAHSVWRIEAGGAADSHDARERRTRVAGTGAMADYRIDDGAAGVPLRSPWGLATAPDGRLLVAMAGSHQLWWLDPAEERLALAAGTGREEIEDGPGLRATLAQPTGVAAESGRSTFGFADCETSAVRLYDSDDGVRTLVGTDLFKFGDRPGVGDEAMLQHCEDVVLAGDVFAVADTYNDRLKALDPRTRECVPWPGAAGEPGGLLEPGGVSGLPEGLLVADTGNHRLLVVRHDGGTREVTLA